MLNRKSKAIYNSLFSILYQIISVICGLIVPRMILKHFGSTYNGLASSITQFISYIVLLKTGIGAVTRASLYKPLANRNIEKVSEIVKATSQFMKKVGVLFIIALIVFSLVFPFLFRNSFNWFFIFTLTISIGISSFFEYTFGFTYELVLKADQREYITIVIDIKNCSKYNNYAIMLKLGFGFALVKLVSSIIFLVKPLFLMYYVPKYYKLKKNVDADKIAISQRWDAFAHGLSSFVHSNTDIVILTIFSTLKEISVYTIYSKVIISIRNLIYSIL